MRIREGFLGWGVFFVLVGAIPLAVRNGLISGDVVSDWWSAWPLILIGIGVALVLRRTVLEFLGGLIVAATFGIMVGAALAGGSFNFPLGGCGGEGGASAFPTAGGLFSGPATVSVEFNCGNLALTQGSTSGGWSVEGVSDQGHPPRIAADGDSLSIKPADNASGFLDFFGPRSRWTVGLPADTPITLEVRANAGEATLSLGEATLERVDVELNAGSTTVDLASVRQLGGLDVGVNAGSASITLPALSTSGTLKVNAGSIEMCAPPDAALRLVTNENIAASYDFGGRTLTQTGTTYESPGYASAEIQIEFQIDANAASFSLDPEEGCRG